MAFPKLTLFVDSIFNSHFPPSPPPPLTACSCPRGLYGTTTGGGPTLATWHAGGALLCSITQSMLPFVLCTWHVALKSPPCLLTMYLYEGQVYDIIGISTILSSDSFTPFYHHSTADTRDGLCNVLTNNKPVRKITLRAPISIFRDALI